MTWSRQQRHKTRAAAAISRAGERAAATAAGRAAGATAAGLATHMGVAPMPRKAKVEGGPGTLRVDTHTPLVPSREVPAGMPTGTRLQERGAIIDFIPPPGHGLARCRCVHREWDEGDAFTTAGGNACWSCVLEARRPIADPYDLER